MPSASCSSSFQSLRPQASEARNIDISIAERYKGSIYDALIFVSADETDCKQIYSMQRSMTCLGCRIIAQFRRGYEKECMLDVSFLVAIKGITS